jgi:hypothetical protein
VRYVVLVFRKPLFTIIMAPKRKSSDAGSASELMRSLYILFICDKLKIPSMVEIGKESYAEITRLYGKNDSSIR